MEKDNMLYQIRTLEKMIIRKLLKDEYIKQRIASKPKHSKLTPVQLQILECLLESKNQEVYQKDLETILNLRRATVSGVLKTMEKNNLIIRKTNGDDKRTKKIILNSRAKEIFNSEKKQIEYIEKQITKNIQQEDIETFYKVINTMKKNLEENFSK